MGMSLILLLFWVALSFTSTYHSMLFQLSLLRHSGEQKEPNHVLLTFRSHIKEAPWELQDWAPPLTGDLNYNKSFSSFSFPDSQRRTPKVALGRERHVNPHCKAVSVSSDFNRWRSGMCCAKEENTERGGGCGLSGGTTVCVLSFPEP